MFQTESNTGHIAVGSMTPLEIEFRTFFLKECIVVMLTYSILY